MLKISLIFGRLSTKVPLNIISYESSNLFFRRKSSSSSIKMVVVETKLGKVRGKIAKNVLKENYYSFQGVPYAKAPTGNLRFKAPQPIESWNDEFDATKEGPACPSLHLLFMNHIGKEDNCLNLNIYTKTLPKPDESLKPVMVWIHGGGFIQGANTADFFGPDYLMMEDVVQVFINYRLGILGFLCLEDESLGVPGNAGLKDQVMALKWIKEHISNFGGDPNNITIYGESAGSASVHFLVLSPTTKGLFNKAILQSGSTLNPWAYGQRGIAYVTKQLGIKEDDESKILEHLMKMCPKKLISMQMKAPDYMQPAHKRVFGPVIEKNNVDAFLTDEPMRLLETGNYNKVPMIMGFTSNEGLLYEIVRKTRNFKGPLDFELEIPYELGVPMKSEISSKIAKKIEEFYGFDKGSNEENVAATYLLKSDHHFLHGIYRMIDLHLKTNTENPMYVYMFSFEGDLNYFKNFASTKNLILYFFFLYMVNNFEKGGTMKNFFLKMGKSLGFKDMFGCSHADDLGYLFRTFFSTNLNENSREFVFIRRMVKLWTNFAKSGNPTDGNFDGGVVWKNAKSNELVCMDLGEELKMIDFPYMDRMEFWNEIYKECGKY